MFSDILWNDIGWPHQHSNLLGIFADYYNRCPDGTINVRFSVPGWDADFVTPEYEHFEEITKEKWESNRGTGLSFGYNRNEVAANMVIL